MKNEAQFTTFFSAYIKENKPKDTCVYEIKFIKHQSFSLKNWKEKQGQQLINLVQSSESIGTYHKISDQSLGSKPFDSFYICNAQAYLVLYFAKYREFFMIEVDDIPESDSISYTYCKEHFIHRKLLAKKPVVIIDF